MVSKTNPRAPYFPVPESTSAPLAGVGQPSQTDCLSPLFALVDAAAARLQTADAVAAAKYKSGSPIDDPQREQQVIDTMASAAAAKNIDVEYIKSIFHDQMDATNAIEHARFAYWKLNRGTAPAPDSDLPALRVTIDRLNRIMIAEIGIQWDALRSPSGASYLDNARNAVVEARRLDALYERALVFATHSYCRQA